MSPGLAPHSGQLSTLSLSASQEGHCIQNCLRGKPRQDKGWRAAKSFVALQTGGILSGKTLSGQRENKAVVGVARCLIRSTGRSKKTFKGEYDQQNLHQRRATTRARHLHPSASTAAPPCRPASRENRLSLYQNLLVGHLKLQVWRVGR